MNLSEEVDLEDYVGRPDKISNAEIAAICQEAGMHAVRKNRYIILPKDFEKVLFFIPSGILQHNGQNSNLTAYSSNQKAVKAAEATVVSPPISQRSDNKRRSSDVSPVAKRCDSTDSAISYFAGLQGQR